MIDQQDFQQRDAAAIGREAVADAHPLSAPQTGNRALEHVRRILGTGRAGSTVRERDNRTDSRTLTV